MIEQATATASLDEVLNYRHPAVVRRYVKDHGGTIEEAREIFQELLKWLYIGYRGIEMSAECVMTSDIEKIDWMWHTFLLFTRDYADFCDRNFGMFLHHVPEVDDEDEAPPAEIDMFRTQLEDQYGLVYDVLGDQTLTRWYADGRYAAA